MPSLYENGVPLTSVSKTMQKSRLKCVVNSVVTSRFKTRSRTPESSVQSHNMEFLKKGVQFRSLMHLFNTRLNLVSFERKLSLVYELCVRKSFPWSHFLKIEREHDSVGILLKDRIFSETYKSLDLYIFDKKGLTFVSHMLIEYISVVKQIPIIHFPLMVRF